MRSRCAPQAAALDRSTTGARALFAAEGPVSAVHLARTVKIDESSVYRNLEVLESHGLIRHVHLGHGPGLYVLLSRDEVESLYCGRCGEVRQTPPDQLDTVRQAIKDQFGYEARFTHFAIVGICKRCATTKRSNPPSGMAPRQAALGLSDQSRSWASTGKSLRVLQRSGKKPRPPPLGRQSLLPQRRRRGCNAPTAAFRFSWAVSCRVGACRSPTGPSSRNRRSSTFRRPRKSALTARPHLPNCVGPRVCQLV